LDAEKRWGKNLRRRAVGGGELSQKNGATRQKGEGKGGGGLFEQKGGPVPEKKGDDGGGRCTRLRGEVDGFEKTARSGEIMELGVGDGRSEEV